MNIYADNAATTKLDKDAFDAMKPYLLDDYSNPSQPYSFSRSSKNAINEARRIIAECIGAEPEEIFFTSGGTESDNWAIKGTALYGGEKRCIVTSEIEHHAVLRSCEALEYLGYPVAYIRPDTNGTVEPQTLDRLISSPSLVSVMYANNEIGTIQPIEELAEAAHRHNAYFHTDAVQAVGHVPINVKKLNVDMLSASAHKFNGPKGAGFLYIKSGTKLLPLMNGGSQENGIRAGTENVASIVGMAAALKKNTDNIEEYRRHIDKLTDIFLNELRKSDVDYILNGHPSNRLSGNISLSINGKSGESIMHLLDMKGICISTGSACDSVEQHISHVIRAVGVPENYAAGTVRITFGKDNSEQDAFDTAQALIKIVSL